MVDKTGIELANRRKKGKLLVMTGKGSLEFRDRGFVMKKSIIIFCVLMAFFTVSVSYSYEREIKTVEGLIESVTDDSIKVRGRYYDFTGVPLEDASGKNVQKDQLKVGRKVEIFFQNNSIKTILVYPERMSE